MYGIRGWGEFLGLVCRWRRGCSSGLPRGSLGYVGSRSSISSWVWKGRGGRIARSSRAIASVMLISGLGGGNGQSTLRSGFGVRVARVAPEGSRAIRTTVVIVVTPNFGLILTELDLSYILKVDIYISCVHCE